MGWEAEGGLENRMGGTDGRPDGRTNGRLYVRGVSELSMSMRHEA